MTTLYPSKEKIPAEITRQLQATGIDIDLEADLGLVYLTSDGQVAIVHITAVKQDPGVALAILDTFQSHGYTVIVCQEEDETWNSAWKKAGLERHEIPAFPELGDNGKVPIFSSEMIIDD